MIKKKNCLVVKQLSWMSKRSKIVQLHGCTFKVDNVNKNDLTHFRGKPVLNFFFFFCFAVVNPANTILSWICFRVTPRLSLRRQNTGLEAYQISSMSTSAEITQHQNLETTGNSQSICKKVPGGMLLHCSLQFHLELFFCVSLYIFLESSTAFHNFVLIILCSLCFVSTDFR